MDDEVIKKFEDQAEAIMSYKAGAIDQFEKSAVDDLTGEEKSTPLNFFKRVIELPDTLRTANLTKVELGEPDLPVRSNRALSLFCEEMGSKGWARLFKAESEITLSSSLSRDGFLDRLAVTTTKETSLKTGRAQTESQKRGWWGRNKREEVNY